MELSSDNDFIDDKLQTSSSNMDYSTSMLVVDDVKILKMDDKKTVVSINDSNLDVDDSSNCFSNCIHTVLIRPRLMATRVMKNHNKMIMRIAKCLMFLGVCGFTIAACVMNFHKSIPLLVILLLCILFSLWSWLQSFKFKFIKTISRCCLNIYEENSLFFKWTFICLLGIAFMIWIALDTMKRPEQLVSAAGYLACLLLLFITSVKPSHVKFRPVIWGCLIQISLAFIVLRTKSGFEFFNWLGNLVQIFINYVDSGVSFLFGKAWPMHFFAFKVLSIVIYFSSFISILYYLGAMQWVIKKISWLMQITLGTSSTESLVAAGNIFVGQTEAPLLIRPYLEDLTMSELHSVMVCGFGTVSGSVLGAYLGFGIQPVYVITACVMASPCALAVSKIVYPETEKSAAKSNELQLEKGSQRNVIEAACEGASQAIPLVLNIAANLVAFLALLAALNGGLEWLSSLVNCKINFEIICSYIFYPFALLIGVKPTYSSKVAELIGKKIILNEFIAYEELSKMIVKRDNGTYSLYGSNGELNWIDEKSEAVVTYALCGFANVGSLGIVLGGLGSIVKKRQSDISKIVLRALIGGVFVSVLNSCVAGFLYEPRPIKCEAILSQNFDKVVLVDRLFQCCTRVWSSSSPLNETLISCCKYDFTSHNLTGFNLTSHSLMTSSANCTSL